MDVKKGYLLITDISGYTQFLVESELAHAKEILDSLLATTVESIRAPVRVLNTRGDAVLCFVDEDQFLQPQSLLEAMQRIYFDFRSQLSLMGLNTTCPCNACVNIETLDLKVFVHYGEYIEQDIAGATELQGADVILVNLLMKNSVKETFDLHGYGLVSDAAVAAMDGEHLVGGMHPHLESYEHFENVGMRIWDLPAAWDDSIAKQRTRITDDEAWHILEAETTSPPWIAWDFATDADSKRRFSGLERFERVDGVIGPVTEGAKYHCVHKDFTVELSYTDWDPPGQFTNRSVAGGIPIDATWQFVPIDAVGTRIRILIGEPTVGDKDELEQAAVGPTRMALDQLVDMLESASTDAA